MVFIGPLIFKSSCLCTITSVTVQSAPITVNIIVTFIFHSFFRSLVKSRFLCLFSLSFNFTQWSTRTLSPNFGRFFFSSFCLNVNRSDRLAEIRKFIFCLKIPENFVRQIFLDRFWVVHAPFVVWSNLNFLHNSQWITMPTHSFLFLYSLSASYLYSFYLIDRIVSKHIIYVCRFLVPSLPMLWRSPYGVVSCCY